MFAFGSAPNATSIDPEQERAPPPAATVVYFPQNDIQLEGSDDWLDTPPNLFKEYSASQKPSDVKLDHVRHLNITVKNEVEITDFLPKANSDIQYLPPPPSRSHSRGSVDLKTPAVTTSEAFPNHKHPLLSNGHKSPDRDQYERLARELAAETEDGLRVVGRRKSRTGMPAPSFHLYRKFWAQLEIMSTFWDSSLDHYFDSTTPVPPVSPTKAKRWSISLAPREPAPDPKLSKSSKRYKGRRSSTGSKMPDHVRIDTIRAFIEPVAIAFSCHVAHPKRSPQLQIKNLLIPVTQAAIIWREPQDKAQAKRGIMEGPVVGVQCRAETNFLRDKQAEVIDSARECAGLLVLAQARAREGKPKVVPGAGKWYTSKPRWGGGPGGEFGEAEGNKDIIPQTMNPNRKLSVHLNQQAQWRKEEAIWKELKPGPSLWEPRMSYIAIGKNHASEYDDVFMISALFHHISFLKMTVHSQYLDFTLTGDLPPFKVGDRSWTKPLVQRTRWFDLFNAEDRVEALRVMWGLFSYNMRPESSTETRPQMASRQKSEASHVFPFRKKHSVSLEATPAAPAPRSFSVAF